LIMEHAPFSSIAVTQIASHTAR